MLYLLGAPEVAVIELSVGAGLVTVLFVFAINIAGDESLPKQTLIPAPIATGMILVAVVALLFLNLPGLLGQFQDTPVYNLQTVLWQDRSLDLLMQGIFIFAGVLGILGLLAEGKGHVHKETEK